MTTRIAAQLPVIDKSNFSDSEFDQKNIYREAKAVVLRLEKPREKIWRIISEELNLMIAAKTAGDLEPRSHLSATPKSIVQLTGAVGADP